jgi:hypothetical protein
VYNKQPIRGYLKGKLILEVTATCHYDEPDPCNVICLYFGCDTYRVKDLHSDRWEPHYKVINSPNYRCVG